MGQAINVILLGNNSAFMEFVAHRLRADSRLSIIGIAWSPSRAIEMASRAEVVGLAVIDLDVMNGCCPAFVQALRAIQPQCRVVLLSAATDHVELSLMLDLWASALVSKSELLDTLDKAVCEALQGGVWFPESVRARIVVDSIGPRLGHPHAKRRPQSVIARTSPSML